MSVNYKNLAIKTAKEITRAKGKCERCGRDGKQYQIHGAHILSVRFAATAADLDNILALCSQCHVMAKDSWHESPSIAMEWFNNTFPGRHERLYQRAQAVTKRTSDDWKTIYEELRTTRDTR